MNLKTGQVVVAFLVGLIVGGAIGASPLRRHLKQSWDKRAPHERMVKRLSHKLDLTPEQKTKVAAIFEAKKEKIDALFAEGRPKFDKIRAETREEIRKILNPDQIKKYEELEAKMEERFKKRRYRD